LPNYKVEPRKKGGKEAEKRAKKEEKAKGEIATSLVLS
jgi:hypothetical protein